MILGIYGSGGAGRELRELAELQGCWEELVFIDDTVEEDLYKGIKRMPFGAFCQRYRAEEAEVIIAQGEPEHKIALYHKAKDKGYYLARLIHPTSYISESAKLGQGIVIQANAFVSCNTVIEDNTHILQGAIIGHDCVIQKHCQISPGVTLGGSAEVKEGTYIGLNASIKDRIQIGANTIVSMGAVVLTSIPENVIVLGNPARAIKEKNKSRVFAEDALTRDHSQQPSNLAKYDHAFMDSLEIQREQLKGLKYRSVPAWNSIGHMALLVAMEEAFDIEMSREDMNDFDSYEKGKEILAKHYHIEI